MPIGHCDQSARMCAKFGSPSFRVVMLPMCMNIHLRRGRPSRPRAQRGVGPVSSACIQRAFHGIPPCAADAPPSSLVDCLNYWVTMPIGSAFANHIRLSFRGRRNLFRAGSTLVACTQRFLLRRNDKTGDREPGPGPCEGQRRRWVVKPRGRGGRGAPGAGGAGHPRR
jgi:hypothetical protein